MDEMAPKKQQPKKNKQKLKKPVSSPSSLSFGPRLQISAENESRLRRLLLKSGQTPAPVVADDSLSRAQNAKRLRSIYEKLSCVGFAKKQIELALSALKDESDSWKDSLDVDSSKQVSEPRSYVVISKEIRNSMKDLGM